jgi:hypothetical protein
VFTFGDASPSISFALFQFKLLLHTTKKLELQL